MTKVIVFLLAGLFAGVITVALGTSRPTFLAVGVGPLFFSALLAAIAITNSWSRLRHGIWRYVLAVCLCTGAYILALFTFSVVAGYSPQLLGVRPSGDITEFRADVWIGLLTAALVASICIELLAYVVTNKWSNSFLALLIAAGLISVVVTFLGRRMASNLPSHQYWSFLGVLLTVGEALFCGVLGAQILASSRPIGAHL